MRRRGTRAALAALGIGALALTAAPAHAGKQAKSKLKIKRIDTTGASGTVTSKDVGCEPGRKVKLFLIGDYVPVRVGKDSTNGQGKWKVAADLERGRYYSKVAKTEDCKGAESNDERI